VIWFQTSSNLAAAYGVAVTATMVITTVLFYVVARRRWGWSAVTAGSLAGVFLVIDAAFFGANIIKVAQGGWLPLVLAGAIFTLLLTWKRGSDPRDRIQTEAARWRLHPQTLAQ
jgi:KUP system potassium uptake protein